jgi:hypothetical protein
VQTANQFKQSGGFIIVIAYQQPNEAPIPGICRLASPGMCFITANESKNLFVDVANAFCAGR